MSLLKAILYSDDIEKIYKIIDDTLYLDDFAITLSHAIRRYGVTNKKLVFDVLGITLSPSNALRIAIMYTPSNVELITAIHDIEFNVREDGYMYNDWCKKWKNKK